MKYIVLIVTFLLSSTVFAFNFASPKEPSAILILNHQQITKKISPVRLLTVNGENVSVRSDAAWLSPGTYDLTFAAWVNRNYTQQIITPKQRRRMDAEQMTLNVTLEADKSYYVGFDTSSSDTEDWKPVVYKVE